LKRKGTARYGDSWSLASTVLYWEVPVQGNAAIGGAGAIGGAAHGGGMATEGGPTLTTGGISFTVIDTSVLDNVAQGANGAAGNGGNGFGGGLFVDAHADLTLEGSTVTGNEAIGGTVAPSFSDGKGQGGGIYIAIGGSACADVSTTIDGNSASTSNDDVFGVLEMC
jgi:hypothetical protein